MLTPKQKALLATIILVAGALLFPAWKFTLDLRERSRTERPAGHHFLFSPPDVPADYDRPGGYLGYPRIWWSVSIDTQRTVLLVALATLAGAAALVLPRLYDRVSQFAPRSTRDILIEQIDPDLLAASERHHGRPLRDAELRDLIDLQHPQARGAETLQ